MSTPNDTSASKVDILGDICTMRRRRVAAQKIEIPFSEIDKSARAQPAPRGFRAALARKVAGSAPISIQPPSPVPTVWQAPPACRF
jgi:hypothetical protein